MTMLLIRADFAKSYVAAHTRTLPNGKVVQVSAFSDKRYKQATRDFQTADMFKPNLPAPQKKIPDDCARHPEKCTPDLFTGEVGSKQSGAQSDNAQEATNKVAYTAVPLFNKQAIDSQARKGTDGAAAIVKIIQNTPNKATKAYAQKVLDEMTITQEKTRDDDVSDDIMSPFTDMVVDLAEQAENKNRKTANQYAQDARAFIDQAKSDGKINGAQHHKMSTHIDGALGRLTKSFPRIVFFKSHIKEYIDKNGRQVKEHDDKRTKKLAPVGPGRKPAAPPEGGAPERDAEDIRGSAHGYGTHNIEEGDALKFKAGDFEGGGKVKSAGKDGAVVTDESGRDHNVHWHEVTGFKADRGDGGGKKPPVAGGTPVADAPEPPKKEDPKSTQLGKQEPIPAESFKAADYAKSHDQADVSAESIIATFPPDTKEKVAAAVERLKSIEETITKFKDGGRWTPERQELHRKIIYDGVMVGGKTVPGLLSPERVAAARPVKGEAPTFIILGGRGGSGKSSFEGEVYEPERCIVLDADHIKSMLPEYEGWNAAQVHEESGDLFDHIADFARIMGLNVVLDKTMKTAKSAVADVEKFKKSGYRTEAHYMHLPRQEAAKRAVKRFLDGGESGRFVPPEIVLSNTTNEAAFDQVSKLTDAWSFRDNNVARGEKPILISQKGDAAMKRKEIIAKSVAWPKIVFMRKAK